MGRLVRRVTDLARIDVQRVGRQELIAAADLPAFVSACEQLNARIVGFEGFRIRNDGVVPDTGLIADLSTVKDVAASLEAARRFLTTFPFEGIYFVVILAQDPE
jgi:hypothetical protein